MRIEFLWQTPDRVLTAVNLRFVVFLKSTWYFLLSAKVFYFDELLSLPMTSEDTA